MNPAVTVLVDTYNHERFIEEALVSVVEQDFPASEMEIIVVDDGSTDRTPEIVQTFAPRVRLLRKANGGQASAFNFGISEARGEIIAFLDGDDWWARNKLTRVAETMASDPGVGIVGHGIVIVHRDGRGQTEVLREGFRFRADTLEGAKLFRRRRSLLGTSRMTIRRELLRRIGQVPPAIRVQADEYLFTLAAVLATAEILPDALTYYRMHDANAFQLSKFDEESLGNKEAALAELSQQLSRTLKEQGIAPDAQRAITEAVKAEADQARLLAAGGWPWDLVKAEMKLFDVVYEEAGTLRRSLRMAALLPALFMPPRAYYRLRQQIGQSSLYNSIRRRWLPFPQAEHVTRVFRVGH
jgi:GT2 family glycosyltransferase